MGYSYYNSSEEELRYFSLNSEKSISIVTVPGYQGNLQAAISHSASLAPWERFGVEFILTFVVVLSYFVSTDSFRKFMGNSATAIGAAYSACSFVSMPYLNPARSLGPSFVLNKWDNHWVYWFGPLVGGIASGIVYEYVFNSRRQSRISKISTDNDSSSIHSEDDTNYDLDLDKPNMPAKYSGTFQRGQQAGSSQQKNGGNNLCQNLYTAPPLTKIEQSEPLYGGTRSMYCRSPTLTRTNLNRSQSVYAKSNTALNREILPRSGPLVPAQSLYPMRTTNQQAQSSLIQNQNVQNQLQQCSESIYSIRGSTRQVQPHHQQQQQQQQNQHEQHQQQQQKQLHQHQQQQQSSQHGFQPVYGTRHNPTPTDGNLKFERRPESVYGMTAPRNRGQSAQSDDSSYGSYHGSAVTPPARNGNIDPVLMYAAPLSHPIHNQGATQMRTQSERKVSAPIVASHPQSVSGTVTFSANQGAISSQQQQQQTEQQQQIHVQQHQHYGMLPMRQN